MNHIDADDFRVPHEKTVLYASVAALVLILVLLFGITLGLITIIVVIPVIIVKVLQGQLLGKCIKVSKGQLPDVYKAATLASERLCMKMPDVFVRQDPVINAYALGLLGKRSVVLHSATVESMTEEELISIIGHEFSHIKSGHTDWYVLTGSAVEKVKIPIISPIMAFIFMFWSRKAEYTCDRGGLLASRNLKAVVSALAKTTVGRELFDKLSLEHFFEQKTDVDTDNIAKLSESLSTHPYVVNRIHAVRDFHESDIYRRLTSQVSQNERMTEKRQERPKSTYWSQ